MLYKRLLLLLLLFGLWYLPAQEVTQNTPSEKMLLVSESQWLELKSTISSQSVLLRDSSRLMIELLKDSEISAKKINELENSSENSNTIILNMQEESEKSKTQLLKVNWLLTESNKSLEESNEIITTIDYKNAQLELQLKKEKTKTTIFTILGSTLGFGAGYGVGRLTK